jgi:hypothetical protein
MAVNRPGSLAAIDVLREREMQTARRIKKATSDQANDILLAGLSLQVSRVPYVCPHCITADSIPGHSNQGRSADLHDRRHDVGRDHDGDEDLGVETEEGVVVKFVVQYFFIVVAPVFFQAAFYIALADALRLRAA